jgi:hypothetical protein
LNSSDTNADPRGRKFLLQIPLVALHDCATFGRTEADLMGIGIWINNTAGFLLLVPRLKVA